MKRTKAMIMTLGGTIEPVIKSIKNHKPKYICIIASQDSINQISSISKEINKPITEIKKFIVDDHQSIEETFSKSNEAYEWISKFAAPNEVIVDFTPGTKAMSVGLFLAMSDKGVRFCYIGGKKRTKEGVGTVESGHEEVVEIKNPFETFQQDKINQFVEFFNSQLFAAAGRILEELIKNTNKKTLFKAIREVNKGYYFWDLFHYKEAIKCFRPTVVERICEEKRFKDFYNAIENNRKFLEVMSISTKKFQNYSLELFADVYENAQRRARAGHFDDAVLRLYRLTEMIAQERLKTKYNQNSSNVNFDSLKMSEENRHRWKDMYSGKRGLGLNAIYDLLYDLNDELGTTFQFYRESFKKIQDYRNLSFLAHGIEPLDERRFEEIDGFIKEVFMSEINIGLIDERTLFPKIDKNIFIEVQ
jgi:CRISPR-associated protein (TIGR02710 family)